MGPSWWKLKKEKRKQKKGAAVSGGVDEPITSSSKPAGHEQEPSRKKRKLAMAAPRGSDNESNGGNSRVDGTIAELLAVPEHNTLSNGKAKPASGPDCEVRPSKHRQQQPQKRKTGSKAAAEASPASKQALRCTGKASEYLELAAASDNDEPSTDLEGVLHGNSLLLLHRPSGAVFSSERDGGGRLVRVGDWTVAAGIQLTEQARAEQTEAEATADAAVDADVDYPFEVDQDDHCETCAEAYAHIAPLLEALAAAKGKPKAKLRIYDPYYCQGSVVANFAALGFPRVHNVKEDFYRVIKEGCVPKHDALVTNPPYSGDHVERLLRHCVSSKRPWLLLLPNYVYTKEFYRQLTAASKTAVFITPPKRYHYYSPRGSRGNVKSSERKTSPFITFWYIDLGPKHSQAALAAWQAAQAQLPESERCCLVRAASALPYRCMDSSDPLRKKERDRRRSKQRLQKLRGSGGGGGGSSGGGDGGG